MLRMLAQQTATQQPHMAVDLLCPLRRPCSRREPRMLRSGSCSPGVGGWMRRPMHLETGLDTLPHSARTRPDSAPDPLRMLWLSHVELD